GSPGHAAVRPPPRRRGRTADRPVSLSASLPAGSSRGHHAAHPPETRGADSVPCPTRAADEVSTMVLGQAAAVARREAAGLPRVLVVEDDPGLRLALRRALEGAGYEVAAAGDAVTAAERFAGVRPHLVVLDLMLPRGDGLELCRRLRRRPDG